MTRFESPQQSEQSFPRFLPDGRHFLFFVSGRPEARGVYVGSLDGLDTKRLFGADTPAVYAAAGYLLFVREGTVDFYGVIRFAGARIDDRDLILRHGGQFLVAALT